MQPNTHLRLSRSLCGEPVALSPGSATVSLTTTAQMAADVQGLVHGGFVFGAADHAAMLAVNEPHVVLGAADLRFVAPVSVGEVVTCRAEVTERKGRKHLVTTTCAVGERTVLTGTLTCFVLDQHVLDRSES
ncbi:MAG: PaaI family thioesterase [Deltaproteobacteria bacterium]|nr:MAG: PaaI family thioesterase [Deltaproteobacteria bacterium]